MTSPKNPFAPRTADDYRRLDKDRLIGELLRLQDALVQQSRTSEQALHDSKIRLKAILDTAVDGIITINRHGIVQSLNPAVERMFGYAFGEIIGNNVTMLMPSPYREQHDSYIRRFLRTGQARVIGRGREVMGQCKDGTVFPADLAISQLHDGEVLFTGIIRDISARKQAETQMRMLRVELEQTSQLTMAGELAAMLAHELNQPLTAAVTYSQLCLQMLQAANTPTERLVEVMEKAISQNKRAGEIIRHLRDLVQKSEPQKSVVDINALIAAIASLLESELRAREIVLLLRLEQSLPAGYIDPVQIQQVLLNLIRNSIEAMQQNEQDRQELTIETKADGDNTVKVAVSDTGSGLSAGTEEAVFQPFFTNKISGMGMGLSISRSIVEAHRGCLWASPNRGRGVTFYFTLPIARESPPQGKVQSACMNLISSG